MLGINVKKTNEELIISWQLAEITIPLRDVIEVTEDATYAGVEDKGQTVKFKEGKSEQPKPEQPNSG
ncbi:SunI/YnzG family protein, partial [Bacillus sp. HC-TM]